MEKQVVLIECRVCHDEKKPDEMKQLHGKPCKICRRCDNKGRNTRYKKTPVSEARKQRINAKMRSRRASGENLGYFVLKDSRQSDKVHNRLNDLTREFVEQQIAKPCTYCELTGLRMTLDRIDNLKGHLQSNVQPSCMRCNYIRRNIPYEAWILMIPGVKAAAQCGAFGSWDGSWKNGI
jgi:hypothetical protein